MGKLTKEDIVVIQGIKGRLSNRKVADAFGVTEGTVRHHIRQQGCEDGRKKIPEIVQQGLDGVVHDWWRVYVSEAEGRPASISMLYDHLRYNYGYSGSYKSVRKFVRSEFKAPEKTPWRRIETPPGAQSQSDWCQEGVYVDDLGGHVKLPAFLMVLSHSRHGAVIWTQSMDQMNWLRAHNEAYRRLGGVAAVNRIDNLKTGISKGCGPWGTINPCYRRYSQQMRFHVDAHEVRRPNQKGKIERLVGTMKRRFGLQRRRFRDLEHLQAWTDEQMALMAAEKICPPTGKTIYESWRHEQKFLGTLPMTIPEPFDLVKTVGSSRDCIVRFEGREYWVTYPYAMKTVEIRGCGNTVQIFDPLTCELIIEYPRHSEERLLIPLEAYKEPEGMANPPRPLGKMAKRMADIAGLPIEQRPLDLYAALAEVAR